MGRSFKNSVREVLKGKAGEFLPGTIQLDEDGSQDVAIRTIEVVCEATIGATAEDADGMGTVARDAWLAGLVLSASTGPKDKRRRRYLFNELTLPEVFRYQRNLIEEDMVGFAALATTALAAGDNVLTFAFQLATGRAENILPKRTYGGMGRTMLRSLHLAISYATDTLKAADANLTMKSLRVEIKPGDVVRVKGDRWCNPAQVLRLKGTDKEAVIELPDGLPYRVADRNKKLADNTFGFLTVTVGDETLAEDPDTAQTIFERWDRQPDSGSTEDDSAVVTDLLLTSEAELPAHRTGVTRIKQRAAAGQSLVAYDLEAVLLTPDSAEAVKEAVELLAAGAGEPIVAVCDAAVRNVSLPDRVVWVPGFSAYPLKSRQAAEFCGLACEPGGKPYVHIPAGLLSSYAFAYARARADKDKHAEDSLIRKIAEQVPGIVTSTEGVTPGPVLEETVEALIDFLARAKAAAEANAARQKGGA